MPVKAFLISSLEHQHQGYMCNKAIQINVNQSELL